ncbi:fatty acid desaturase [Runella slithyformis]|uniref:Fatty acid desaturase n=1 Tax=Runella slithyformis (strain ATCC 29530 / DSM 19594 / LMG 11500 / NCIMB 11436 / LSU 4) TaxID=761193 RepID=A0A7U3ZJQ7_RUNSL|nr:fatty acid desaturase [Runella slithyformis]AEI48497.1 fatty acid desaturase [Runella slithyformis DSM 19594]
MKTIFDKIQESQGDAPGQKQDESEKQKTISPELAKKIRSELQQFALKSNLYGIYEVSSDYLILLSSALLIQWTLVTALPRAVQTFMIALSMVVSAAALKGLNNLIHQACHYTLYATKSWNDNLQFLTGYLIFRDLESYRLFHSLHHKYLNTELDPENAYRTRWLLGHFKTRFWTIVLIRPLFLYYTYDFIKYSVIPFWTNGIRIYEKLTFWLLLILCIHLTDTWLLFSLVYVVPVFVIYPLITAFVEASEHIGLSGMATDLHGGRNRHYGWIANFVFHRHNEGNHGLHHWVAHIPDRHLNAAFEFLKKNYPNIYMIESHSLAETLGQMFDAEK